MSVPKASKTRVECASAPRLAEVGSSTAFVGGFVTRGMLVGFAKLGLATERLCASAGLPPAQLMDPAARVPSTAFWSVWRAAERLSGDPSLGLHLAQAIPLAAAGGMIGQLAAVSETGLDAIRHLARYQKLFADRFQVDLREDESTLSIEFRIVNVDNALARQVYESALAGCWRIFGEAIMAELIPLRVSFRHSPPPDVACYERFFGCPVEFRASSYRLRLPLASLRQPMIAAQPRVESRLHELLDSELRTLAPEFTVAVAEQVRAALEEHERPSQTSIARRLGIGARTLQRRLHDEGSSFRRIADREHRDLALALLGEPRHRVIDVAHAAGFDDATSFAKAFRRWTGESPTAYRARVLDRSA
jgi:AraC-like DNA-binding protein